MEVKLPENFTDKVMHEVRQTERKQIKPMGGSLWVFGIIYACLFGGIIAISLLSKIEFEPLQLEVFNIRIDNIDRLFNTLKLVLWISTGIFTVKLIQLLKNLKRIKSIH